jgi:hypothetical protein
MILPENLAIDIKRAEYLEEYKLRLEFSNSQVRVIDFGPFLENSCNPMIRKYLDLEKFRQFSLDYGNLFWDDYGLCFPLADLYEGQI